MIKSCNYIASGEVCNFHSLKSIENRESEKMSSARTDYESNHMLCERAKKRRKLLREKAAGAAADGMYCCSQLNASLCTHVF